MRRLAPAVSGGNRDGSPSPAGSRPARFFACGEEWSYFFLGARLTVWLFLLASALAVSAAVKEVGPIRITVGDLDQAMHFYTEVLPFREVTRFEEQGRPLKNLTGTAGARARVARLRLGAEQIELVDWLHAEGRPIPADSRSFDHWFQHIAIVVSDMDRAYEHLRRHRVKHVSTAPQTLPDWNPNAGGIKAFYFRDPEDHVLEIIWFPPGKGDPRWQQTDGRGTFLGIDHTAIVVGDTERSLAFYRDELGLQVAGASENHGIEQERLNQVFGARLRITALRAKSGPGIEFLEYITPPGGRQIPADRRIEDLASWMVVLHEDFADTDLKTRAAASRRLLQDPDGHSLLVLREPPKSAAAESSK
ncbi:MAG TPA: glyoxalase [Verrucomicrobiales bacterium]|nr:glyoxalase [Verrucomicrobiales bacterium]